MQPLCRAIPKSKERVLSRIYGAYSEVHEHRRDGKDVEIVVAEYHNVAEEFKMAVEVLLIKHGIKSRSKIQRIKSIIIGGDHGQGAFRLCILVLIELVDEEPIDANVSIGKSLLLKRGRENTRRQYYGFISGGSAKD